MKKHNIITRREFIKIIFEYFFHFSSPFFFALSVICLPKFFSSFFYWTRKFAPPPLLYYIRRRKRRRLGIKPLTEQCKHLTQAIYIDSRKCCFHFSVLSLSGAEPWRTTCKSIHKKAIFNTLERERTSEWEKKKKFINSTVK